jgi:type II secretory pathway pseudopilin PulG
MTLIELLIVILIVGLLTSLAAPNVQGQMERARAQEEFLRLQSELRVMAFTAYAEGRTLRISASGGALKVDSQAHPQRVLNYSYLFFDPVQSFTYLSTGYATADRLRVMQRGRAREVLLNQYFFGEDGLR